ncbi:MAG: TonB-dependent receptor [Bryobacteraceae bacterium]|nr:TonB-dependent receptor [Bryobacteraceae bacterium]
MLSLFASLLLGFAPPPTGEIRLSVRDASGAAIQATGDLNGERFATDRDGRYTFANLPFGRYRLRASRPGFVTKVLALEVVSSTPLEATVDLVSGDSPTSVTVIATTPLAGAGLTADELPVTAQAADAMDLRRGDTTNLGEFLQRRLNGIFVNEIQGNPFQPDVNYRGYTASPLLGTPQGLSVYMDGVRLNQPFGDVMSWDLVPRLAIAELTLMPGSNPLFGLNTLGGALALETKSGVTHPGTSLQVSGGSFGRRVAELEHGGSNRQGLNWYLASNFFFEDGWRQYSPSNVRQGFARLGWRQVHLAIGYASNLLNGNGLQEFRMLERDRRSTYTLHDATRNRSPLVNLSGKHAFSRSWIVSGNTYFRSIRTRTFNGDINEGSLDQSVYQPSAAERAALAAAGFSGFPTSGATAANTPFPFWRCLGNVLLRDEPAEKCSALINRGRSSQASFGAAGQFTWLGQFARQRHQLTGGAAFDRNWVQFRQSSELGYLNPDRSVAGTGAYGDGVTGGDVDGAPYDTRVDLDGHVDTHSFYATDTINAGRWNVTVSGRFNRTVVNNLDRILPTGAGSLTGRHVFVRFNPAAGATYSLRQDLLAYFNYSEGSRAPTSIELGCADPENPCKLPNAMAGDPPLRQVITRTWESGLRGRLGESGMRWNLGWFRAGNRDDILFVASPQTGYGYFQNFQRTRRQGFEAGVNGRFGSRVTWGGNYTLLQATFDSSESLLGESNSRNTALARGLDGLIRVQPGNTIPLSPRHTAKAFVSWQVAQRVAVDFDSFVVSRSYARGNENNLHQPDGTYYLGAGSSPGYFVTNAGVRFTLHRRVEWFLQANNLFNRSYVSAAQLGPAGFTAQGTFVARPFAPVSGEYPLVRSTFLAPGAPRAAWSGLRFRF